jgi:hypothetical protein
MMHHDAIYRRVALCKTAHFFIGQVRFKLRQCCEHSSLLKHLHHERHRDRAASSDSAGNRPPQPRHRAPIRHEAAADRARGLAPAPILGIEELHGAAPLRLDERGVDPRPMRRRVGWPTRQRRWNGSPRRARCNSVMKTPGLPHGAAS